MKKGNWCIIMTVILVALQLARLMMNQGAGAAAPADYINEFRINQPTRAVQQSTEPAVQSPSNLPERPSELPTIAPTSHPTHEPTQAPTVQPTLNPTHEPTVHPTAEPTWIATQEPALNPTPEPTVTRAPEQKAILEPIATSAEVLCRRHVLVTSLKCNDGIRCNSVRQAIEDAVQARNMAMAAQGLTYLVPPNASLRRNDFGLPKLASLFEYSIKMCPEADTYTYINGDILLDDGFVPTLDAVSAWRRNKFDGLNPELTDFMVVGPRMPFTISGADDVVVNISAVIGEIAAKRKNKYTEHDICWAVDYFSMTRDAVNWSAPCYSEMVLGRPGFDMFIVDDLYRNPRVAVVNGRKTVAAAHLIDANDSTTSNSAWRNASEDDNYYNLLKCYNRQHQHVIGVTDFPQYGMPCQAVWETIASKDKQREGREGLQVMPSRKIESYDGSEKFAIPGSEYLRKRGLTWQRKHRVQINTTLHVIGRSRQALDRMYHGTLIGRDSTHGSGRGTDYMDDRVDISFKLTNVSKAGAEKENVPKSNVSDMESWVETSVVANATWDQGQAENFPNYREKGQFALSESELWFRMLKRTRFFSDKNHLLRGEGVISRHSIIVDADVALRAPAPVVPPTWYKWVSAIWAHETVVLASEIVESVLDNETTGSADHLHGIILYSFMTDAITFPRTANQIEHRPNFFAVSPDASTFVFYARAAGTLSRDTELFTAFCLRHVPNCTLLEVVFNKSDAIGSTARFTILNRNHLESSATKPSVWSLNTSSALDSTPLIWKK